MKVSNSADTDRRDNQLKRRLREKIADQGRRAEREFIWEYENLVWEKCPSEPREAAIVLRVNRKRSRHDIRSDFRDSPAATGNK